MKINSELEMMRLGEKMGKALKPPQVIELRGDVGTGKTTFVQGLAKGLKVRELVTSPSFTISKTYVFLGGKLVHYDFYRLMEPGIMAEDLLEVMKDERAIVVVEWAETVKNLLPKNRLKLEFSYQDDGSRKVEEVNNEKD